MQRIRDAAKWLIGASAAVGAALIAGSQLSSIGLLPFGWRLGLALVGVVVALLGVVVAIWLASQVLLPVGVTLGDLNDQWDKGKRADVRFFHQHPRQLGTYKSPAHLRDARDAAWDVREQKFAEMDKAASDQESKAAKEAFDTADQEFRRLDDIIRMVLHTAQFEVLKDAFKRLLPKLMAVAGIAAGGIVLFAWAANPPPATSETSLQGAVLRNADLRDADLKGTNLRDADLQSANLEGADLSNARVEGVKWLHATCPDGVNSDAIGGTCLGHLSR